MQITESLKNIELVLTRIAIALEKKKEPKELFYNNITDCIYEREIPFPTPWNSDYKPTCKCDSLSTSSSDLTTKFVD